MGKDILQQIRDRGANVQGTPTFGGEGRGTEAKTLPGGRTLKIEKLKWTLKYTVKLKVDVYPFYISFGQDDIEINSKEDIPMIVKYCMEEFDFNQTAFGLGHCEVYNRGAKDVIITRRRRVS